LGRGQLWWGYGQLQALRRYCVNLAHLSENFSAKPGNYDKLDLYGPVEKLAVLESTFCPMEREVMLRAALVIVRFYQELVPPLAEEHAISYPAILDQVLSDRLKKLCDRLLV
ncbi:MAG: hypothetical protein JSU79_12025, partial [Dehalococcoidales bacterium]